MKHSLTPQMKQIRRLSFILIGSVSLNIILSSLLGYQAFFENSSMSLEGPLKVSREKPLATNAELSCAIGALKALSIEELMMKLPDRRVVENGFTVGDLSLGALAGFYYFDIERALGKSLEKKILSFGSKGETLVVYPTLSETDFSTIESFIRQEKWPFRAQGLYRLLKNGKFKSNSSLEEAFSVTPEFISIERLLSRASVKVEKKDIIELALSVDWGKVAAIHEKQKEALDISEGPRRLFLLDWILQGSQPAAEILLKSDWEFALKKIDDITTVEILTLLKDKQEISEKFASEILKTPRSDIVRRSALTLAPEIIPEKETLAKLVVKPTIKPLPPSLKISERIYIIEQNDSLWKIAKKFNVTIESIRKLNALVTDDLKPGRPLRIPLK